MSGTLIYESQLCYNMCSIQCAKEVGAKLKNVRKFAGQQLLDVMHECGRRIHRALKRQNTKDVSITKALFITKSQWTGTLLPALKRLTPEWQRVRGGGTYIFQFSSVKGLSGFIPEAFLTAEWENTTSAVQCSDEHPVQFRYNTNTCSLSIRFVYLATNIDGSVVLSRSQKL